MSTKVVFCLSFSLVFVFNMCCFAQQHNTVGNKKAFSTLLNYINQPNPKDTACITGIEQAKSDLGNGKKVFCVLHGKHRAHETLVKLTAGYGMTVYIDCHYDVLDPESTFGCYCAEMIKANFETYGMSFRKNLFSQADSTYIATVLQKGQIIPYWNCDIAPYRKGKENEKRYYTYTLKEQEAFCAEYSQVDLTFNLSSKGAISDVALSENGKPVKMDSDCAVRLLQFTTQKLKNDQWQPGQLGGQAVNTCNAIRVYLVKPVK